MKKKKKMMMMMNKKKKKKVMHHDRMHRFRPRPRDRHRVPFQCLRGTALQRAQADEASG